VDRPGRPSYPVQAGTRFIIYCDGEPAPDLPSVTTSPDLAAPPRRGAGTLAALRRPLFAQLLTANFVSSMGVWLYVAAAAWVMLALTDSPLMVGLVTGSTFFPRLLLAIPAGALIDVLDRRQMVVLGNVFQALVSITAGVLNAGGRLGPWTLVLMTLLLGSGQALAMPAYHSVIQDVVPRNLVAAAVTLHSGSVNFARAIGPAIGGVFIAAGHTEMAFVLNGVSYFALCAVAFRIPPPEATGGSPEPMSHAMRTGVRFVRHSPSLLKVFLVSALFALTSSNLQALLAPVADARQLGAQGYGLLFSCFGVGALVGVLTTRRLTRVTRRLGTQTVSITLFGLANLAFAVAPGALLAALAIAVAGAAWVITFATLNTAVQLGVPTWVRGRVLSIYMMAFTGAMPLGSLISGALGGGIGATNAVAVMSISVITVAVATAALRLPSRSGDELAMAPDDWPQPSHAPSVPGGPVAVLVSWVVADGDREDFLAAMRSVRRSRLRSGAVRWRLFDDHEHPERMIELFEVPDWDEHLRQHGRLDREAVASLRRARGFHVGEGAPDVQHLIGVDLHRQASFDQLDPAR
jgi:MFS family permease